LQDAAARINEFRGDTGLDPGGLAAITAPHLPEYEPGLAADLRPTCWLLAVHLDQWRDRDSVHDLCEAALVG